MNNPAPAPDPAGVAPAPESPRPPTKRSLWLGVLRWIAYHWWLVVAFVFVGNYLPGAVIELVQFGWKGLGAYLTSWGFLRPLENDNPPLFFVGIGLLALAALVGFVVEHQEQATVKRQAIEREQKMQATHETAHAAKEKAEHVRRQVESLVFDLRGAASAVPARPAGPPQDDGLLPAPDPFVGRAADLTWLEERIGKRPEPGSGYVGPIAAVSGLGGIGKTSLVGQAIREWRMRRKFPEGLAIVLVNDQRDACAIIRSVLQRFDPRLNARVPENASLADLATAAHALLDGKDALIVLDNLEPDDQAGGWRASEVLNILRATGVAVLLTARQDVPGVPPGATRALDVLSDEEARELFARSFQGQPWLDLSVADQQAAGVILDTLGRHTLALTLAARYAATAKRSLATIAAELAAPQRALTLHLPDAPRSVQATFDVSYQELPDQTQRLFRALGAVGANEVGREAILALARGLKVADSEASVDLLVARGLVAPSRLEGLPVGADTERLTLHPLLRTFAGELLGSGMEREQAEDVLAAFYSDYTVTNKYGAFYDAYPVIAADEANITAALDTAHNQGERDRIIRDLSWNLAQYWRDRSKPREGLLRLPWGIAAATTLAQTSGVLYDRSFEGSLRSVYGNLLANTGRLVEAQHYYEQALLIDREVGNRQGEGVNLGNLGIAARDRGQLAEAQRYFEQALLIDREVGDRRGEGVILGNLGRVARDRGKLTEAEHYFEQALLISHETGDRRGESANSTNLGRVAQDKGQLAEAEHYYEQSLVIDREVGDRQGEGAGLTNLGSVAQDRGQLAKAEQYLEQALLIDREVGDRRGEAIDLCHLGQVAFSYGKLVKAQSTLEQSLILCREVGARRWEGKNLSYLARIAAAQGDLDDAEDLHRESLAIAQEVEHGHDIAKAAAQLGQFLVQSARGSHEEGCEMLTDAARRYDEIGVSDGEAVRETMKRLGCA